MNTKVLVSGGAGFIGTNLCKRLLIFLYLKIMEINIIKKFIYHLN